VPYTRLVHGRVWAMHTARLHHPCTSLCTGRLYGRHRPCTWRVHGPVHGTCTRPCTGRAHGRVHDTYTAAYTCLRVQGTAHGRVRAIYMAKNGRLHGRVTCNVYGRVRAVSAPVHGSVQAVCTAVFGRVHWPCTLPFSAFYIARTRPCNGPCTRPLHGRVQGPSGPCIRHVGLLGCVHVPRRHATAVCGPLRHTVRVRDRVHGPCRRTCTRLCMGHVHDRVHGALRPCTRPTAVTCRLSPCTGPCRPTCHVLAV